MTREEIYFDCLQIEMNGRDMLSPLVATYCRPEQTKAAHAAMEQYAKQEAIGFAEFIDSRLIFRNGNKEWVNASDNAYLTNDELYNLYLQSKNQQP